MRNAILAADRAHVWHPYARMAETNSAPEPLVVERAEGSWLIDADGRRYLDAISSWWVAALGHGHPRLVRALAEQSAKLNHTLFAGVTHEPAAMLAQELVEIAPRSKGGPNLSRVFFSDNGSTSVEVALRIALEFSRYRNEARTKVIAVDGAFHGDTLGASTLGALEAFRGPFQQPFELQRVALDGDGSPERIRALLKSDGASVAAVFVEPLVQGAAGMRMHSPQCLRELRDATASAGALFIADEVFTGYGRTGRMWACEHAGVVPDLLCTAKGFTGGMLPMAATLVSSEVFDEFAQGDRRFSYGHSFTGNPLGASVAREVLRVFRDERVIEGIAVREKHVREAFERIGASKNTFNPRTLGMIGAIDLSKSPSYEGELGWRVAALARNEGVFLRPLGDTIYVTPPLNIATADLARLLHVLERSVRAVAG